MPKTRDGATWPFAEPEVCSQPSGRPGVCQRILWSELGSVSVFVVAVLMVGLLLVVALVGLGQVVVARERVVAAAEAGALAAAPVTFRPFGASGSAATEADRLVRANGAVLVGCDCPHSPRYDPRTVTVTARLTVTILGFRRFDLEHTAAAEFRPVDLISRPG